MKDLSVLHKKIDYVQALESKKDLLSYEMCILKTGKKMKDYQVLRLQELKLKNKLMMKLILLRNQISRLQKVLPKVKIPKIPKEKKPKEIPIVKKNGGDIEEQLKEIQRKLSSLGK